MIGVLVLRECSGKTIQKGDIEQEPDWKEGMNHGISGGRVYSRQGELEGSYDGVVD